jgi:hypothetical protein
MFATRIPPNVLGSICIAEGNTFPQRGHVRLRVGRMMISIPRLSACCKAAGWLERVRAPDPLGDFRDPDTARSGAQVIATIPEFFWELSLGIYLMVKGFRPAPITAGLESAADAAPV